MINAINKNKLKSGFTIVELLVVIVVIGILASITIVSYTGVTQKAIAATLQSDLSNAAKQIKMFQALSPTNDLPTANNCPTPGATEICIKTSGTNTLIASNGYTVNNTANPKYFSLIANNGTTTYRATESSSPATYTSLATTDPTNWIVIGSQVWARYNLNVGTMVTGVTTQTNNSILEKYCHSNIELNCTNDGGLYQWDEAMQYVVTAGAQGICPAGSHIPTDAEWKTLEMQLGMSQAQADATSWRGTDQGTQLKPGGASGMNMLLAGYRVTDGSFGGLLSVAYPWSSSESGVNAWFRRIDTSNTTVRHNWDVKTYGFSIRCIGN